MSSKASAIRETWQKAAYDAEHSGEKLQFDGLINVAFIVLILIGTYSSGFLAGLDAFTNADGSTKASPSSPTVKKPPLPPIQTSSRTQSIWLPSPFP